MLKLTLVVSSTFSCLIAETICVCFSAGGAAVAEVPAFPVVLLSEGDLVSAGGVFTSFAVVAGAADSDSFVLLSTGDFVSAVGVFTSFDVVAGAVDALDLL